MGFLNRKEENIEKVNLRSMYLRDSYIDAFSKGIGQANYVKVIQFRNAGLTTGRACKILENFPKDKVHELDFSYNKNIGPHFYENLSEILEDHTVVLKALSIEGNETGDAPLEKLSGALEYNMKLTYLNLSKCLITDIGAKYIAKFLPENTSLRGLFLHWNKIQGEGGMAIANGLKDNKGIQIFDISFNSIGKTVNSAKNPVKEG